MQPFHSTDAPSIEPAVLARLKRLDRDLFLTFSPYVIDYVGGQPIPTRRRADDGDEQYVRKGGDWLLLRPSHHLWVRAGDGRCHHVAEYFAARGFGHCEVEQLEADVARTMRPSEIVALHQRRVAERKAREKEAYKARHRDIAAANMGRIRDLAEGKSGYRTRKAVSYPGQTDRSTPEQRFLSDAREDGWELSDE